MKPESYTFLADYLEKKVGIVLGANKAYLVEARLNPIAEQHSLADIDAVVQVLRTNSNPAIVEDIVDAMTTNETSFFRDSKPFDVLFDSVLPILEKKRLGRIRIWNAACSTGQEPYSIIMGAAERVPHLASKLEIVGTDISKQALNQCKSGVYNHFEVQRGLPIQMLVKNFEQDGKTYTLKPDILRKASFKQLNLLDSYTAMGKFDIIFCRNVLIYFDPAVKKDILERLIAQLAPDGYLFLGGTETILGVTDALERIQAPGGTVYCRADAEEAVRLLQPA